MGMSMAEANGVILGFSFVGLAVLTVFGAYGWKSRGRVELSCLVVYLGIQALAMILYAMAKHDA